MISIFSIFECLEAVATWIAMQRRSNIVRHFNHRFTSTSDDLDPESTSCLDGPALKCQDKLSADLTQKVMVKMAPDSDCSIPTKRFKHQPWHQKDGIKKSYPQNYSTISNLPKSIGCLGNRGGTRRKTGRRGSPAKRGVRRKRQL